MRGRKGLLRRMPGIEFGASRPSTRVTPQFPSAHGDADGSRATDSTIISDAHVPFLEIASASSIESLRAAGRLRGDRLPAGRRSGESGLSAPQSPRGLGSGPSSPWQSSSELRTRASLRSHPRTASTEPMGSACDGPPRSHEKTSRSLRGILLPLAARRSLRRSHPPFGDRDRTGTRGHCLFRSRTRCLRRASRRPPRRDRGVTGRPLGMDRGARPRQREYWDLDERRCRLLPTIRGARCVRVR